MTFQAESGDSALTIQSASIVIAKRFWPKNAEKPGIMISPAKQEIMIRHAGGYAEPVDIIDGRLWESRLGG